MEKTITTRSSEETKKVAQDLVKKLTFPSVLALYGDLGSGKTTFVQGLALGLEVKQKLVSPTFIIHRVYPLKDNQKLHHLDLYRVEKGANFDFLALDELFNDKGNLVVIEWPDKIDGKLPPKTIKILFEHLEENKRAITLLDI